MRRLFSSVLAVLVVGGAAAAMPGTSAAGTVQFTNVDYDVTPDSLPATTRISTRIRFLTDTTYSDNTAPFTGKLTRLVVDLDPDFLISPQGFPQCDPNTISGTTTEQALATCGAADIGSGNADLAGPMAGVFADMEVFNATPAGGIPRVVLHIRTTSGSTHLAIGTIQPTTPDPGSGQRIDLSVPVLPGGYVFTEFDFAIRNGDYITGRCSGRRVFEYSVEYDTGGSGAGSSNQPCEVRPPFVPQSSPSNTIVVGPQNGTTQNNSELTITVPGPGTVGLVGAPVPVAGRSQSGQLAASAAKKPKKKKPKPQVLIAPAQVTAVAAGTIALPLTLTRAGLQALVRKGKVVSGVVITFTPTGGTASTTNATVTISGPKPKRKPKKK